TIRHAALVGVLLSMGHSALAADGPLDRQTFNIGAEPLSEALTDFAKQSGLRVLRRDRSSSEVEVTAPELKGEFSPEEALARLLDHSGWTYEFISQRTVRILPAETPAAVTQRMALKLAQAPTAAATPPAPDSGNGEALQEIVVTAQKRLERLQDVPVP